MVFEKINTPSLKELFIEQLEDMILSGKLQIGDKLPSERELAKSMDVSRSIVNSGINEMAAKGFLEIKPRVGAFVGDYRRNGTLETLLSIMKYNGGRLHKNEIRSLLELKIVLDQLAVRLFISESQEEDINSLKNRLQQLEQAVNESDTALAIFEFHHELALLSGNTILPLIYHSFRTPVLSLWERFTRKYGKDSIYTSAQNLLNAIEEKDLEKALANIEFTVGEAIKGSKEIYQE